MSFPGYRTDSRLIDIIENLTGVEMSGDDHPETSANAADRLWVDGLYEGLDARQTAELIISMLPTPDEDDKILWGGSKFAVENGGRWVLA